MNGCFDLVVCDEAHYLQDRTSGTSLAVQHLQAFSSLLMIATPFFNTRNADSIGYRDYYSMTPWTLPTWIPISWRLTEITWCQSISFTKAHSFSVDIWHDQCYPNKITAQGTDDTAQHGFDYFDRSRASREYLKALLSHAHIFPQKSQY